MKTVKSDFISKGIRCDGDLLLPDIEIKPPVIIMAHGLAAQKNFGLMPYAERFIKKNMAVFLFDYRTFGKSDGTPRQVVDPFRHIEDWKAAISHVRTLKQVNSSKIALWGTSFSGGHVITVGAEDGNICAIVAQVPFMSGFSSIHLKSFIDIVKSIIFGLYDFMRNALKLSPHYSPVIARPGTFAALNSIESYDGFMAIVGNDSKWENKMTSRGLLKIAFYNPIFKAKYIKAPVLIMAAIHDSIVPFSATIRCSKKISKVELVVMDCNHFAPFKGEVFNKYINRHVNFLENNLFQ